MILKTNCFCGGIEGHKSGVCVLVFSNLFMHIVSAPSADPEPLPEAMAEPQPDPSNPWNPSNWCDGCSYLLRKWGMGK